MELLAAQGTSTMDLARMCGLWLRSLHQELSLRRCFGGALAAWLGVQVWAQYGILLRHRNLPPHNLGFPILGHTPSMLLYNALGTVKKLMEGREAVLVNYLFENVVLVTWPVYMKYLRKADVDGEFVPALPGPPKRVVGPNSVLVLPGGKGHAHHKRLRSKILGSMGQKQILAVTPQLLELMRNTLDEMAARTARDGHCTFVDVASRIASRASSFPITAGLETAVQLRLEGLLEAAVAGLMSLPIDLGRFSRFGRALLAREEILELIGKIMEDPPTGQPNVIADLTKASEDSGAFTREEVVDTCLTLLTAGMVTTSDVLPSLFVHLFIHRSWVEKIAKEPLELSSIEADTVTHRFVQESLRVQPTGTNMNRMCARPMDLGEHGWIPAGCHIAVFSNRALEDMGADFNPDRYTPDLVKENLTFGGHQPHACLGKNLALLELQLFARVLCREYDFEAVDTEPVLTAMKPFTYSFANNLRVRVSRKPLK